MRYVPDSYEQWKIHDDAEQDALRELPVCCYCGCVIQDDHMWDILGDIYCEDCAEERFRKHVMGRGDDRW